MEGDGGAELSSLLVQSRPMQRGLLQVNPSGHCHVREMKMILCTVSLTSNLEHFGNTLLQGAVGQCEWFTGCVINSK